MNEQIILHEIKFVEKKRRHWRSTAAKLKDSNFASLSKPKKSVKGGLGLLDVKNEVRNRDAILSMVSHDLRSPLAAISMAIDLVVKDPTFSSFNDRVRRLLEIIKVSGLDALRLTDDLLDLQHISLGTLDLKMSSHDIGQILKNAFLRFELDAVRKSITVENNFSNFSAILICDHQRISQVLSNLLNNAFKFTPAGGVVTLSGSIENGLIKISVSDNGPGVPQLFQKLIFDRNVQIENSSNCGLGLGLYICKSIVTAHGGDIWVESAKGEGSRFCFTLPANLH
ncbi:MAG: HAMP domain-containing histidine kinase [Proteobacteria bacterium]|nr:MAG: HAMP domain-containing histidine kinase [Pseudomonadota bacterium]